MGLEGSRKFGKGDIRTLNSLSQALGWRPGILQLQGWGSLWLLVLRIVTQTMGWARVHSGDLTAPCPMCTTPGRPAQHRVTPLHPDVFTQAPRCQYYRHRAFHGVLHTGGSEQVETWCMAHRHKNPAARIKSKPTLYMSFTLPTYLWTSGKFSRGWEEGSVSLPSLQKLYFQPFPQWHIFRRYFMVWNVSRTYLGVS